MRLLRSVPAPRRQATPAWRTGARLLLGAVVAAGSGIRAAGADSGGAGPPPPSAFFHAPALASPVLCPDGNRLAYIVLDQGKSLLVNLDLQSSVGTWIARGNYIESVHWKGDDRAVFTDQGTVVQSYVFDRPTGTVKPLAEFDETLQGSRIVDFLPASESSIVVAGGGRILVANLATGKKEELCTVPEKSAASPTRRHVLDSAGRVRAFLASLGGEIELRWRAYDSTEFKPIKSWPLDATPWLPVGLSLDGTKLRVITHDDSDVGVLQDFDLESQTLTPLHRGPPDEELDDAIFSPETRDLLGVVLLGAERHTRWSESESSTLQGRLESSFPGARVGIFSTSRDRQVIVLRAGAAHDPGGWFILDRRKQSLRALRKELVPLPLDRMPATQAVGIKARDGLLLHGFLTKPAGGGPRPLILCPFAQPFAGRFFGGYDAEAQFLASRGYAVLKLNYRGTEGYGEAFRRAGRGEIAGRIVDDIHDAAQWAIANGHAPAGAIGLLGEGLGGGLALVAAAERPEVYCCAIEKDGLLDWQSYPERWAGTPLAAWHAISPEAAAQRSPLALLAKTPPVLNVFSTPGGPDPEIERAFKTAGKEFLVADRYQGEGLDPWAALAVPAGSIEAFLGKHLPAGR